MNMKFFSTNKFIIILYFILIIPSIIFGQNKKEPPCSVKEAYQFDFWIGIWDLHWTTKSGKTAYDKNEIKSFLDGCVMHENYTTIDAYPLMLILLLEKVIPFIIFQKNNGNKPG